MSQSEQALHEQREWLRVTLASIGDAVITTDTQGRVTFLNPIAESLTGWSLKDAHGIPLDTVFRIVNEETRATVENPATRALREGVVVGLANHTLLLAKDETERPIDDSAAPIRNPQGDVAGVVLVFRDVTERREAENALRRSEERFRLLVESVKDYAIFMLDPEGIVSSWNTGAERIKGYQADEIVGRHFSCFYAPDKVATGFPTNELHVAATEGRFEDEGWRLRKDGSRFWANVVITAIRDQTGTLRGFSKVTRDLTEHRKQEQTQMQAEVLADLNRRKDEFLAMLSHELRNPLAPILNAVHLLRLQKNDDPIHQQARSIIERQVGHLTRLVDDLLEVSRITSGRMSLRRETLDVQSIVARAEEAVRPLIAQHKHALSVSLPPDPIWVYADATRLEQVIVNLLTNAAKYTDDGGCLSLSAEEEGDQAVLRVGDSGVGIAAELLPHVFDPFTQADRSLARSEGGLGLGLTLVHRLVEMHGGTVQAFSEGQGRGSEFVVRLPIVVPSKSLPSSPSPPKADQPGPGLRVLVVDDNQDTADSTAMLLRRSGHDTHVAYSGSSALEAASAYRPDAILLDIGLPEMDGYQVAARLREDPHFQTLPIIAVSGYGQETDRQRSHEAGFNAHLVKPVNPHDLQELLLNLAHRRRQNS